MDTAKIFELSRGNPELTEVFSFKLTSENKERFIEVCRVRGLSTGAVMRALLGEFLEATDIE